MSMHAEDAATPERAGRRHAAPALVGRPRWVLPAVVGVIVVGALVVLGFVELSTVLYAGAFGGMLLMHLGGHGHGGGSRDHGRPGPTDHIEDAGGEESQPDGPTRSRGCP